MNSSKLIDISKSSLVGLKAELLKKQEEVKRIKELRLEPREVVASKQKKNSRDKSNKNVEERILQDEKNLEEDFDAIKKSREMLEAKARLYDKLKCSSNGNDNKKSQYLIDFDLKQEIENTQKATDKMVELSKSDTEEEENDNYSDVNSDPENDWVDFTDTLGRSKRCLRKDLPEMEAKDAKLATVLKPPSPTPPAPIAPELLSWDMQREMMRQKWEEQETLLLGKTNIHYQDVLFDENRTHGVGYFEFSTDEEERLRQQEALKKLRKETEEQQQASVGLRARRQQQLQSRLAAARRRKRERLGLPPDSPEPPEVESPVLNIEEEPVEEKVEDIEEIISKIAPVRPWDIGKQQGTPVMSQEEWIDKKRQERPAEFAPPSTHVVETCDEFPQSIGVILNYFTSKKTNTTSTRHKNSFNRQDCIENYNNDRKSTEVLNKISTDLRSHEHNLNENPDSTSRSKFHDPTLADGVKTSLMKKAEQNFKEPKDWKPSISDIEMLLAKTKEQTSKLYGATSSCNVPSRNSTADIPPMKIREEKYFHREKPSSDEFDHKHQLSNIGTPNKIVEIINEVVKEDVSSTSSNRGFDRNRCHQKFAAIPPPASMSYYMEENVRIKPNPKRTADIADSLLVGINLLKERSEEKSKKRLKGLLDII